MGIQDTVRRQEEKLAQQGKAQAPKPQQPSTPSQPTPQLVIDVQGLRQMMEDVVRAQFQQFQAEQPAQQAPPVLDPQALHQMVQSVVRAELQTVHTTLTILAQSIQAQTNALLMGDASDEEQEEEHLPTTAPRRTDDDIEDENVYPPYEEGDGEELDEALDEEGEGEEDGYPHHPPQPESPTKRLQRLGPAAILLGDGIVCSPTEGVRRWENHV